MSRIPLVLAKSPSNTLLRRLPRITIPSHRTSKASTTLPGNGPFSVAIGFTSICSTPDPSRTAPYSPSSASQKTQHRLINRQALPDKRTLLWSLLVDLICCETETILSRWTSPGYLSLTRRDYCPSQPCQQHGVGSRAFSLFCD